MNIQNTLAFLKSICYNKLNLFVNKFIITVTRFAESTVPGLHQTAYLVAGEIKRKVKKRHDERRKAADH